MTFDPHSLPEPFATWAACADGARLESCLRSWARKLRLATGRLPGSLLWRFPAHWLPLAWLDRYADEAKDVEDDPRSRTTSVDRNASGEFYTPPWLVDRTIDGLWKEVPPQAVWCDPTAGAGAFLTALVRRGVPLSHLSGCEVNPFSVVAATANVAWEVLQSTGGPAPDFVVPIAWTDLLAEPESESLQNAADVVVGNPPWQVWDRMADSSRMDSAALWRRYGLFAERGMASILGGAKKDLAALVVLRAADRILKPAGRLAFVVPRSLFSSSGGGRGFRRFQIPGGAALRVDQVLDLGAVQPFEGATVKAAVLWATKGEPTAYPLPYLIRSGRAGSERRHDASPSDPHDPLSAWRNVAPSAAGRVDKVLGRSAYRAHLGVNTGGANGVYWIERLSILSDDRWLVRNLAACSRRPPEVVETEIESKLLHPLLRGKDVRAWSAEPSAWLLLAQDVRTRRGIDLTLLTNDGPLTLAYLKRFEETLRARAALKRYFRPTDPFYSMFDVGAYTLSPWKTVWGRMGSKLSAAVVGEAEGKPILPQETHAFFPAESRDEACFLAALLQNRWAAESLAATAQVGGKSFATPRTIERIAIRRFHTGESLDLELAALGAAAMEAGGADGRLQEAIDQAAARYWGIEPGDYLSGE